MCGKARVCKFESAFRSLQRSKMVESGKIYDVRQSPAVLKMSSAPTKKTSCEEAVRRRKEEKAENLMHLICWGPK